LVPLVVRMCPL